MLRLALIFPQPSVSRGFRSGALNVPELPK
jgi:hypothetical protein